MLAEGLGAVRLALFARKREIPGCAQRRLPGERGSAGARAGDRRRSVGVLDDRRAGDLRGIGGGLATAGRKRRLRRVVRCLLVELAHLLIERARIQKCTRALIRRFARVQRSPQWNGRCFHQRLVVECASNQHRRGCKAIVGLAAPAIRECISVP